MTLVAPPNQSGLLHRADDQGSIGSGIWQRWFTSLWRSVTGLITDVSNLEYKSYCFVHKNGTDQSITAGAETLITWATADYDTQSEVDLANEKWVCGKTGVYDINITVQFGVAADGDRLRLTLYVGTTDTAQDSRTTGGGGAESLTIKTKLYLTAADELTFKAENLDNNDTIAGNSNRTFFSIYRLGD